MRHPVATQMRVTGHADSEGCKQFSICGYLVCPWKCRLLLVCDNQMSLNFWWLCEDIVCFHFLAPSNFIFFPESEWQTVYSRSEKEFHYFPRAGGTTSISPGETISAIGSPVPRLPADRQNVFLSAQSSLGHHQSHQNRWLSNIWDTNIMQP